MSIERIVDSWRKIEPDAAAEERMLGSILARNHAAQLKKVPTNAFKATLAACLAVAVAIVAVFGNMAGWFGDKTLIAELGNGNTLTFRKADSAGLASLAWDANWGESISREFTLEENFALFADLSIAGLATFRSKDGAFIHYEGRADNEIKVILSASGFPVTDTPVVGNEETSEINGIPVAAGFFVTKANSQGVKNIIYFASFTARDITVYLELGGNEADSDSLRRRIGSLVYTLTLNPPNTSALAGIIFLT
jgi:hypothetical protein